MNKQHKHHVILAFGVGMNCGWIFNEVMDHQWKMVGVDAILLIFLLLYYKFVILRTRYGS